ncbi:ABC transporter [Halobellus salinus]|uniref:Molybdate/tungstate import ATP-binding protein WtpC n=1 Tax=Halobellus salinus TaxID=931585 RepID=A0A830EGJ8_9EURY|nr:ABC transporter ATP-binding protein [Halobellus salinus]GGJ07766.1 ABC transporter [Halobellus salinus]SMP26517.1 thiamine transport system ATP-binding protein [Halobellus salinus]
MRLTIDNVRKEYGGTVALGSGADGDAARTENGGDAPAGIDLEVADGEFFTLVGPSGCGKTTTLRLVAGFDSATRGDVRFDGRAMAGVPPEDRGVGVVFQNYALFPHLSVAENVAYGLRFTDPPGGETRDKRVASLLELVDLPDAGPRDPGALSGGQRQRVALARALAPGPDLLLLDEPMSALDARLRERLRLQIKRIQSTLGITTLYVTHDQEEALAVSDRVAVMSDGAVEQVGPPQAVYRRPETRFVAEFVGDNNVFEGRVESSRTGDEPDGSDDPVGDSGRSPLETAGVRSGSGSDPAPGAGGGGGRDRTSEDRDRTVFVDVDGTTVPVQTSRRIRPDARVTFCVRPERMWALESGGDGTGAGVGSAEGGSDATVALDATVSNAEFLGESTRTYLRWKGRELTVRTADPLSGDVRVGFDGGDAHVIGVASGGASAFESGRD